MSGLIGPRCELAEFKAFWGLDFGSRLRLGVLVKVLVKVPDQCFLRFVRPLTVLSIIGSVLLFATILIYLTISSELNTFIAMKKVSTFLRFPGQAAFLEEAISFS